MAADQHEALIRAYIDEVFNRHQLDGLGRFWGYDLASHWLGMESIRSLPAWRLAMEDFFAAFPDATYTLDDMFFAGDRGVWRGNWQATQQGKWQGIAASGRNVTWTMISELEDTRRGPRRRNGMRPRWRCEDRLNTSTYRQMREVWWMWWVRCPLTR